VGQFALDRRVTLLANVALVLEYEAECPRDDHLQAAGLDAAAALGFVDALAALAEPVDSHFVWRPQLRDPSDEMVLEAAVTGRAEGIVSFNLRDFGPAPTHFGVAVWLPRDALRKVNRP
jgi:hypothetical protein